VVRREEGRRLEVWEVSAQVDLFDKISRNGAAKMANGHAVTIASGNYEAGSVDSSDIMFRLSGLYGNFMCANDELSCVLHGSGTGMVMMVCETSGSLLELRSMVIAYGYSSYGGGLCIFSSAQVSLVICSIQQNEGLNGGGGIYVNTGVVDLYCVSFSDNTSLNGVPDIRRDSGTVTIHSTCSAGEN